MYSDVITVTATGGTESFNRVQVSTDTVDAVNHEVRMDLALMAPADPVYSSSLAFHVNASDLATDILDYSTRYFSVVADSIINAFPSQRSSAISMFPDGGTMTFGGGPVHTLSLSYNNLTGPSMQFDPHFRGSMLEERYSDGRNGTYEVYNASWQLIQSGWLAAPRTPVGLSAGWYHLVIGSHGFELGGGPGKVTLTNTVNLASQIPDPPVITSFAVLDHGRLPTDSTGQGDAPLLRFSARLPSSPGQVPVEDSTRAFFRRHRETEWLLLPVTPAGGTVPGFGVMYTAPLTAATQMDSCGIDIRIRFVDTYGNASDMVVSPALRIGTWINDGTNDVREETGVPSAFALHQNYPNPFNPGTTIRYSVPGQGTGSKDVRLTVHDLLGREVALLDTDQKTVGDHEVKFDAAGLSSGVYFYRLTAGSSAATRKMLLLR